MIGSESPVTRTHVILDGLQDPALGQALSRAWREARFDNAVDVTGMSAWLAAGEPTGSGLGVPGSAEGDGAPNSGGDFTDAGTRNPQPVALREADLDRAVAIARTVGVELRDRSGVTFIAANTLDAMRARMQLEYRARWATALVFVLPALALHYFGAFLAGGPTAARGMLYPWLFEVLLVGWAWWAGGWPILWQGGLAARAVRGTGDLLSTVTALVALVPAAAGVVALVAGGTWLTLERGGAPLTHAAAYALLLALLQRRLAWSHIGRIAGRSDLLIGGFGRLVGAWLALAAAVGLVQGYELMLAVLLVLPPLLSLGAVHRTTGGWSMALPVLAFGGLLVFGPGSLGYDVRGVAVEVAAGFGAMMTGVFAVGWRGWEERGAVEA